MKQVAILVPVYNEAASLPILKAALDDVVSSEKDYDWTFLFVNDGSLDGTLDLLKQMASQDERVQWIDLSRNFGKENAMLAGFDYADADAVIVMDADMQHPPALLPSMLRQWEAGYEDVYAKRDSREKEPWLRRIFSKMFYRILKQTSRFEVLENVGDFRLLDRKCVEALCKLRETERYTKGMFCWIGFRKKEILFECGERVAGQSTWGMRSLFHLAWNGITSFSTFPLRLVSVVGMLTALSAFVYMLWVFTKAIFWGDPVAGYPTIMTVMLFLGGFQLLGIGIIGEYLGKVYSEVKKRPVYFVREKSK